MCSWDVISIELNLKIVFLNIFFTLESAKKKIDNDSDDNADDDDNDDDDVDYDVFSSSKRFSNTIGTLGGQ